LNVDFGFVDRAPPKAQPIIQGLFASLCSEVNSRFFCVTLLCSTFTILLEGSGDLVLKPNPRLWKQTKLEKQLQKDKEAAALAVVLSAIMK
jgi:hypothetical protein